MGACISSEDVAAKQKKRQKRDLKVPEFFYLNKLNKKVLELHPDAKITKIQIPKSFDLHTESAISYLSQSRIMLAGGTDSTSCLASDAYIADMEYMRLYKICPLPIPAKEGSLIEYDGFVYYTGGLIEAEDEASFLNEEPAPFMRYSIKENFWEYLDNADQNGPKNEEFLFIPRKVMKIEEDRKKPIYDKDFPLSKIILPGMFFYDTKIYFVGGYSVNANRKIRMNKNVYSLNLKSLEFKKENFKLAIKSAKPACGVNGDEVITVGGYNPKTGKTNSQCYIINMADTTIGLKDIEKLSFELSEGYPAITSTSSPIFISFPKFAFWDSKKKIWEIFDIGLKDKNQKKHKSDKEKSMKFWLLESEESEESKLTNPYESEGEAQKEEENSKEEDDKNDEENQKIKSPNEKKKSHKIKTPKLIEKIYDSDESDGENKRSPSIAPLTLAPGKAEIIARPIKADLKLGNKYLPQRGSYSERNHKENIIKLNPKLRRPKIKLREKSDSDSSYENEKPKMLKKLNSLVLPEENNENSVSSSADDKSELIIDPNGEISPIQVKKITSQNGKANTEFQISLKSAWD